MAITINQEKHCFLRGNKPFFFLSDTVWSAFTNASERDWEYYIQYRKQQGFNALQINILEQHDRSLGSQDDPLPYAKKANGGYDFSKPNEAYFAKAEAMVKYASTMGFIPLLVLLWRNYVPYTIDTHEHHINAMTETEMEQYVHEMCTRFRQYEPMYIVSGDSDFSEKASAFYVRAAEIAKSVSPEALLTFHPNPNQPIPKTMLESGLFDFYVFQSGHNLADRPHRMAKEFTELEPQRMILNGEPCYEGMKQYDGEWRFSAQDVRAELWQSLLAGAPAGSAYGAHGLWSWHRKGDAFPHSQYWDIPHTWEHALTFRGAWDYGFAKWLFERYNLFSIMPDTPTHARSDELRLAKKEDESAYAAYFPFPSEMTIGNDLSDYETVLIDLQQRNIIRPELRFENGTTTVLIPATNSDYLVIATNR